MALVGRSVTDDETVAAVAEYADIIQIGARNMQNYPLLRRAGRTGRPILLKRGMAATIKELLLSAEYIIAEGNDQVILCERGIRSFDTMTRNLLDLTERSDPRSYRLLVLRSHYRSPLEITAANTADASLLNTTAAGVDMVLAEGLELPGRVQVDGRVA